MTAMILDIVVIVILIISTLIAILRGFVREVLTILGLIGTVVITWFTGGVFKGFFSGQFTNWAASKLDKTPSEEITHLPVWKFDLPIDLLAIVTSYGVVFILAFIALALLNMYVSNLVQESELSGLDRALGALFGLFRGIILVVLLYMPISLFVSDDGQRPKWLESSKSVPLLEYTVNFAKDNILQSSKETIKKIVDNKDSTKTDSKDNDISKKTSNKAESLKEKILNNVKDSSKEGYKNIERDALKSLIEKEIKTEEYNQ